MSGDQLGIRYVNENNSFTKKGLTLSIIVLINILFYHINIATQ